MSIDSGEIVRLIQDVIPDADVSVRDMRDDGQHYAVHITSSSFHGKTRVEQHQMVYKALESVIEKYDQALAIQTSVPD